MVLLKASGATAETLTLTAQSSGALASFSAVKTYTVQASTGSATALVADVYGADTTYGDANASGSPLIDGGADDSLRQSLAIYNQLKNVLDLYIELDFLENARLTAHNSHPPTMK